MPKKKFTAVLERDESNPNSTCFVKLPFDVRAVFGRARPPVRGTVNGFPFRSTVAVYGGEYFLPVNKQLREGAQTGPGRAATWVVEEDDAPRVVEPPPDLAAALAQKKHAAARAGWEALSYSHRKEHAEALLDAKKPETRARRLAKTLELLAAKEPAS